MFIPSALLQISLQRLAAQVCGLFVEIEGKNFGRRLATVLPIIANTIKPERFEMGEPAEDPEHLDDSRIAHRIKDHLLFNTLSPLDKVIKECQVIKNPSRQQDMAPIWESVEAHMLHPHTWARLVSSRLIGLLFAAWKPEELVTGFQKGKVSIAYLQDDLPGKVTKLCGDVHMQLHSPLLEKELGEQRSCVLRWLAAVSVNLGKDVIEPYLEDVLSPVHREFELASTYKDSDFKALAQEVLDLIKGLVGRETFSRAYASLQQTAAVKRETRKRKEALEAVADPAKSARKKLKKNLAKKETRKRKLDSRKPERKLKAPRMERK